MIKGYFDVNVPMVQLAVGLQSSTQASFFVLDTGFTGDLQVTPQVAQELGLTVSGAERMRVADGREVEVQTALAFVEMEGMKKYVKVLIS